MAEIVDITYQPRDVPMDPPDGFGLLGLYRVSYDDGFTILMPHTGYGGTISAEPLDPGDDEHRRVLEESAERMRMAHEVETEIELWRMADGE